MGLGKSGGGEAEGIVGALHSRRCGFVLPGDPRCAGQACQGQITVPEDGCMWERNDRRITTRGQSHEREKVLFAHCFVFQPPSAVFTATPCLKCVRQLCQNNRRKIWPTKKRKRKRICVSPPGVCGMHISLARPGSLLVSLYIFQPFSPSACNSSGCFWPSGSRRCNAKLCRLALPLRCQGWACLA